MFGIYESSKSIDSSLEESKEKMTRKSPMFSYIPCRFCFLWLILFSSPFMRRVQSYQEDKNQVFSEINTSLRSSCKFFFFVREARQQMTTFFRLRHSQLSEPDHAGNPAFRGWVL